MKALLLAAGLGTRLRPLTDTVPKCLVEINGRPLLDYWLETLFDGGVNQVIINLHYLHEKVLEFINTHPDRDRIHTVYEAQLLGTAGTLAENRTLLQNQPFLLIHADNFSIFDLAAFREAHATRPEGCEMTMMTFETDAPETCGIVELDQNQVVRGFHEKVKNPPGRLANGAVYILEPTIFNFIEAAPSPILDFSTQVLPEFIGKIFTFQNTGYHRDIGTMESYLKAQERIS